MAITSTPAMLQGNNTQDTAITAAATNTLIYTAGANGGIVQDILISSTDTAIQLAQLFRGSQTVPLASITIPAGAGGAGGNPAINVLSAVNCYSDEYGNRTLRLKAGETLKLAITAITGGKTFQVFAQGMDL